MKLITKDDVKCIIDSAEKILYKCFEMLLSLKHARDDLGNIILNFQPKLAECLYNLMQFYHKLISEKKALISLKASYDTVEFSKIMFENASFLRIVKTTIEIGKSLGDAYVWFFFRDNKLELNKHLFHKSTGLFTSGIGGLGELEFIKNTQNIDGLYVIYHGITSMLRIGDFSLYALDGGIVGVGELKTKQEEDTLKVSATITTKVSIRDQVNLPDQKSSSIEKYIEDLQKDFPKIKRQLSEHSEAIKAKESDFSEELYTSYEYDIVNNLTADNPIVINSDNSLMLVAGLSKYESLFDVLYDTEEGITLPENFEEKLLSLNTPPSPYNTFVLGKFVNKMSILSIPILWWEIDDEICKNIYFYKMSISTVFNPAKLLQYYLNDGFEIIQTGKLEDIKIQKIVNNHRIGIGNFQSLCHLITNNLMKTADVYASSQIMTRSMELGQFKPNSKINLQIHLNNFGSPKGKTEKK